MSLHKQYSNMCPRGHLIFALSRQSIKEQHLSLGSFLFLIHLVRVGMVERMDFGVCEIWV